MYTYLALEKKNDEMRSNFAIKRVLLEEERIGTFQISSLVNGQVPLTPVTRKVIRLNIVEL